jgi:Tfp pilus assembly protein PilF
MVSQRLELMRSPLLVAALCLAVSGCATLAPGKSSPPSAPSGASAPSRAPAPDTEDRDADVPQQNSASIALLEQSRNERAAGDFSAATVSIERALRIEPNDPSLWIELAEIKAAEGDRNQAETMARKALTLAGSDRSIRQRAERLL